MLKIWGIRHIYWLFCLWQLKQQRMYYKRCGIEWYAYDVDRRHLDHIWAGT